jgi:hypothetical protein
MIGMAADAVRKTSVVTASASFVPLPPENMVAFGSQAVPRGKRKLAGHARSA